MPPQLYLEDSFYGRQKTPAWHKLGRISMEPITAEQALLNPPFLGGFSVGLKPTTIELNGVQQEFGGYGIVRLASKANPKEHVFDTCTKRYKPLQPMDVCKVFDESVNQPVETLLFLGNGEKMVLTWRLPDYEVKVGDIMQLYGTIGIGFDTKYGANLFTSTVRTVCGNTFVGAQAWANANTDGRGKGNIFHGKAVNDHLLPDLGIWMKYVQENAMREAAMMQNFFANLVATPVQNDDHAHFLLSEAFPSKPNVPEYYPDQKRTSKQEQIDSENEKQAEIRDNVFYQYKNNEPYEDETYWRLFNAGTYFFNHVQPSKKAPYASIMFGSRANNMKKLALTLAENV